MVMLTFSQLSNCRDIKRIKIEGMETDFKPVPELVPTFSRHFHASALVEGEHDSGHPAYSMSDRTVPGGPDPLHN